MSPERLARLESMDAYRAKQERNAALVDYALLAIVLSPVAYGLINYLF